MASSGTGPVRVSDEHAITIGALPRRDPPSAEITRHLLDYLLSGAVKPGTKLPSERQLAASLDVGRSGVREAIKSLSLLGLLDVRQGDGTYLSSSTSDLLPRVIEWSLLLGDHRISDLMEARDHIEVAAAGLAAERAGKQGVAHLRERIDAMRAAPDLATYVEADIAFHLDVAAASGNVVFADLLQSIQSLLRDWGRRALELDGAVKEALSMHLPIVEAIERGDPPAARAAMAAHNSRWQRRVKRMLAATRADDVPA